MRTTVDIAEDVLRSARALAAAEGSSLGEVISRLARRGLRSTGRLNDGDLPTFVVPEDSPPLTLDAVRSALDDQ